MSHTLTGPGFGSTTGIPDDCGHQPAVDWPAHQQPVYHSCLLDDQRSIVMDEHDPVGPRQPSLNGLGFDNEPAMNSPQEERPAVEASEELEATEMEAGDLAATGESLTTPAEEITAGNRGDQAVAESADHVDHTGLTDSARLNELSDPYLGRWQQLVSTSNWEKGRIILEWREALIAAQAPVSEYADDAWSTRVETVSGQHVGRLRRVYHRFGTLRDKFDGLYWSHFQAALDWDDAEMWLEGAVQNSWSVTGMRQQRWEAMGARSTDRPQEEDLVVAELDEDRSPDGIDREISGSYDEAHAGPLHEGPDFGEERAPAVLPFPATAEHQHDSLAEAATPVSLVSPFRDVEVLPGDLGEAVELMKLAILRHRAAGWIDVNAQVVLDNLEALKQLLLAPGSASDH